MPNYSIAGHWLASISFAARVDFSCIAEKNLSQNEILKRLEQALPAKIFQKFKQEKAGTVSYPFLTITDPLYPSELREIPYAPPVLFYQGNIELLKQPKIAIVGTRFCSTMAKNFTFQFSRSLSRACCIISGLAYGIDREAHQGALARTIGILGQGLGCKKTSYQRELCDQILKHHGLLLSEFHPEKSAQKWTFIQRNRTIAGLSKALIVSEAPKKSGALISAQNALDFNREVYAVPNHPFHQNAEGCLQLLRDGAHIALSASQIVDDLGLEWIDPIMKTLEKPYSTGDLAQALNLPISQLLSQLSELEAEGLIQDTGLFWQRNILDH